MHLGVLYCIVCSLFSVKRVYIAILQSSRKTCEIPSQIVPISALICFFTNKCTRLNQAFIQSWRLGGALRLAFYLGSNPQSDSMRWSFFDSFSPRVYMDACAIEGLSLSAGAGGWECGACEPNVGASQPHPNISQLQFSYHQHRALM